MSTIPHCGNFSSTIQMKKINEQDKMNIMTAAIVAVAAVAVATD